MQREVQAPLKQAILKSTPFQFKDSIDDSFLAITKLAITEVGKALINQALQPRYFQAS